MAGKRLIEDGKYNLENRQRTLVRYTYALLVDLIVLGLFIQYWDKEYVESFTIALFTAVLLSVLLQLTIRFEHGIAYYFKSSPEKNTKIVREFAIWSVLFISKLMILEFIDIAFGRSVLFYGAWYGLIAFIVVVTAIIISEKLLEEFIIDWESPAYYLLTDRYSGSLCT